jgi:ribonuclease HI
VGWFDGVTAGNRLCSGVGGVIQIDPNIIIKWNFNLGGGTNNRAELIGVWTTLLLAKLHNIQAIQIIEDSKLVIEWCKGRGRIHSLALEGWKDHISRIHNDFENLSFIHSYRQFNKTTDELSKRALLDIEHIDQIIFTWWIDNAPGITQLIYVF